MGASDASAALLQGSPAVLGSPAGGSRKAWASAMQQLSLLSDVHWAAAVLAALPACWAGCNRRRFARVIALLG
jgi:hypothetical protein